MRFLIAVVSAVMVGCAGMATQQGFEQLLRSWEGNDINSLIGSWGPPTRVDDLPNGTKMYTYTRAGEYTTPVYVTPTYTSPSHTTVNVYGNTAYATTTPGVTTGGQLLGGQTFAMSCTVSFTTDGSQRIVAWRYEGNNCKAIAPRGSSSGAQAINADTNNVKYVGSLDNEHLSNYGKSAKIILDCSVFNQPTSDARKVGSLKKGAVVTMAIQKDGWLKIEQSDGLHGWILDGAAVLTDNR